MNEFSDLEAELKQLRPTTPSDDLTVRVERALTETPTATPAGGILPRRPTSRLNWLTLGLGVGAAAALFLLLRPNAEQAQKQSTIAARTPAATPSSVQSPRALVPDGLTRVVYNTRDDGLVFAPDSDQPVRRRRARSRETLQWKNPHTGASLRVTYPTEEVELIPVSGQ